MTNQVFQKGSQIMVYVPLLYLNLIDGYNNGTNGAYMIMNRYPLPLNNGNSPLLFLVLITHFFSWIIFINDYICILTGFPG